mmetsp:Transcript_15592/g.20566  ORF Transcript_15592/g.20566 Transcript_15592/m.20566 type:complete len:455 (+) Transcript_15592:69-1433(+)|eukprot:CAMPEP_0117756640 /NCGR_PEP_ID=MMETSP0947-20121206/14211_1 /TAXON_ID=44440 /ORGANISM="Chattonella subsalsa, Strain CCMP2191" /LENGTH=454 /DNA_ID=CAMNT_0005576291 /DNA_START=1 /DNA_END=1365 /DNA_ORIENTATION=-
MIHDEEDRFKEQKESQLIDPVLEEATLEVKEDKTRDIQSEDLKLPSSRNMVKKSNGFIKMEPMSTTEAVVAGMQRAARFLAILTMCLLALAIPFYSYDLLMHGMERHYIAWFSAGGFVLLTFPISMMEIYNHLSNWYMPQVQRYVVRILWMVPVYSVESWLSLRFKDLALYFETLRDCYEAYVMYSFVYFLFYLLGDEANLVEALKVKDPKLGVHPCPFNWCCSPWKMGREFLEKCKFGVLQYVVLKNLMAALTFVLVNYELYGEGEFHWTKGYLYVTIVNNFSQSWALYVLIKFYYATREELAPFRPLGKFLCVKTVVFATWWQSVTVSALRQMGLIEEMDTWSQSDIANGLQNYLICIEMFIAALAHSVAFTYKDYMNTENTNRQHLMRAFIESSVPADMLEDFRNVAKKPRRKRTGKQQTTQSVDDHVVDDISSCDSIAPRSSSSLESEII